MDALLARAKQSGSFVVYHCSPGFEHEANGAFLIGAYLIVSKYWKIQQVEDALGACYLRRLRAFRDAGLGPDNFPLTVIDCLKGLSRAM